ncbi:MAG: DUF4149 domain-containing protein [Acidobacteriota bacterium]|nr:DUF4149 domain-containing protein [Acidobacteriota bacterium]MDH3530048.1 DUF4149 domain-containing protein [Acidobacteriota bacterium]
MKLVAKIELLLIALWLGAACFFSFGVAPAAFAVLPSAEMAGNVVNRTLLIVNVSGLIVAVLTLATSFLPQTYPGLAWAWARRIFLLLMAAGCAVGQFVIGFWIAILRAQTGKPVDQLANDDPIKLQFDMLHQASVWTLIIAMAAALIVFFLMTKKNADVAKDKPLIDPAFDFSKEMKI